MNPKLEPYTLQQQRLLADYVRSNELSPDLQVNRERVCHYRRLVFNIVLDMTETVYPIAYRILGKESWYHLTERFFHHYSCDDPQVWKMPRFLIDYVKENEQELLKQYPFLPDLLILEWKELEWFTFPDKELVALPPDYLRDGKQYFYHPENEILILDYPVFRTQAPEDWKKGKGKYFLLIYRHIHTDKVHYSEISPLFAFFWESIKENKPLPQLYSEWYVLTDSSQDSSPHPEKVFSGFLEQLKSISLLVEK